MNNILLFNTNFNNFKNRGKINYLLVSHDMLVGDLLASVSKNNVYDNNGNLVKILANIKVDPLSYQMFIAEKTSATFDILILINYNNNNIFKKIKLEEIKKLTDNIFDDINKRNKIVTESCVVGFIGFDNIRQKLKDDFTLLIHKNLLKLNLTVYGFFVK